ncbi:MAG: hypothetical protein Greene041619_752 [Candidatus Peregrinibacteria bacterium Greene0416_19]|nr:MAG: hypothetical protein Greene041619_752 [Candidatus Peregrinibacteria bacterium Greene0416_19]
MKLREIARTARLGLWSFTTDVLRDTVRIVSLNRWLLAWNFMAYWVGMLIGTLVPLYWSIVFGFILAPLCIDATIRRPYRLRWGSWCAGLSIGLPIGAGMPNPLAGFPGAMLVLGLLVSFILMLTIVEETKTKSA